MLGEYINVKIIFLAKISMTIQTDPMECFMQRQMMW